MKKAKKKKKKKKDSVKSMHETENCVDLGQGCLSEASEQPAP